VQHLVTFWTWLLAFLGHWYGKISVVLSVLAGVVLWVYKFREQKAKTLKAEEELRAAVRDRKTTESSQEIQDLANQVRAYADEERAASHGSRLFA
jgi:hypothetical protein